MLMQEKDYCIMLNSITINQTQSFSRMQLLSLIRHAFPPKIINIKKKEKEI